MSRRKPRVRLQVVPRLRRLRRPPRPGTGHQEIPDRDRDAGRHERIVAGIGCSGNMVHLLEGPQPYGFHGVHGRTLPVAMGIKMSKPELNVVGAARRRRLPWHWARTRWPAGRAQPQRDRGGHGQRRLRPDEGQSSPTTDLGFSPTLPLRKGGGGDQPAQLYLTMGVSYLASAMSSKIKEMAGLIFDAMMHPGFLGRPRTVAPAPNTRHLRSFSRGTQRRGLSRWRGASPTITTRRPPRRLSVSPLRTGSRSGSSTRTPIAHVRSRDGESRREGKAQKRRGAGRVLRGLGDWPRR